MDLPEFLILPNCLINPLYTRKLKGHYLYYTYLLTDIGFDLEFILNLQAADYDVSLYMIKYS